MAPCWILVITVTLKLSVASPIFKYLDDAPSPVKLECILEKCGTEASECLLDAECRKAIGCAKKCFSEWDDDNTSEKYHVQNCSNTCAFSYKGKAYLNFMTCVGDNQCMKFPPIPSQCKAPSNVKISGKLSTRDLNGLWWVVGGRHPVYDCYPCQHLLFQQRNATSWNYLPKYYVYLENGSLALMNEEYIIPDTQPGAPISFVYHDTGLYHNETWYLIDEASDGSYILQYYCGNTLEWYYDGFLVLSRSQSLPDSSYAAIATTIKTATGLDFSSFCRPQTLGCTD